MQEIENSNILAKWASGELLPDEKQELEDKINLKDLSNVLKEIDDWSLPQFKTIQNLEQLKQAILIKKQKRTKVVKLRTWYSIAAGIALLIGSYFIYNILFPSDVVLITQIGEEIKHKLPNGSTITLDAMSQLEYNKKGWDKSREISISGRAFIDVTKGPVFKVKTTYGIIEVLGTQFNVTTHDNQFKVFCYEGSIKVTTEKFTDILGEKEGLKMIDNVIEHIEIKKDIPDWIQGFTEYDVVEMSVVVNDLHKYYTIDLQLPDKYKTLEYSGMIVHNDLNSALELVFTPMGISYTLTENNKVIFE